MPFDIFSSDDDKLIPCDDKFEKNALDALVKQYGDKRMLLEWDDTEKCIVMGKANFSRYTNFKGRKAWIDFVLSFNEIVGLPSHPKWRNKSVSAVMGGSPAQLYRWFNQLQYKMFVVPYKDLLTKIAFQRGRIDSKRLELIKKHEPILRQAWADKQFNILPILMETGKTPQQLKKELGKTWKVLCANSLNKNKAVAKVYSELGRRTSGNDLHYLAVQPTTVLSVFGADGPLVVEHVAAHYRGKWHKYDQKIGRELLDTRMLADQLDKPFDALWSPRRMKEEHDSMSKELAARRFSPAKLEILDKISVKHIEHEGYVATLLDSRALVAEEGNAMGHCVAGYAESVAGGRYLVYSITKGGQRSSTLGINVNKKSDDTNYYRYSQHYGRYNSRLEDEHESHLGEIIVKQLNGESV